MRETCCMLVEELCYRLRLSDGEHCKPSSAFDNAHSHAKRERERYRRTKQEGRAQDYDTSYYAPK